MRREQLLYVSEVTFFCFCFYRSKQRWDFVWRGERQKWGYSEKVVKYKSKVRYYRF